MVILVFHSIIIVSAQDVRYYQLTRKVENGNSSASVSGGQFITFIGKNCFESNNHGVGVNHGTMERNDNYSNSQYSVYQQKTGSGCYWGKDATFKFNADKSVLNVVLENGDVYIYKRATAPAGQETCSLIRISGGGNGGYTSTSIYPPQPNPIAPPVPSSVAPPTSTVPPIPSPEPRKTKMPHSTYKTCPLCHGSGKCNTCNGTHRSLNGFTGKYIECPNCKPDGKCSYCNGTGKVLGPTEWY